jgi:N-acetylglucosaminyldiphosphoundecaprenol N-acetyl-beta-D-mannosaminyltransferase
MVLAADHNPIEQLRVLGLPVHQTTHYVEWLWTLLRRGQGAHVVTLNAEMCIQAETNLDLKRVIQTADLVIPDGAGIELYFRWLRGRRVKRYPGIELAADVLSYATASEKVVFYGGSPEVVTAAAQQWQQQQPTLNLVAVQHGYLSDREQATFCHTLKDLQPDIVLVGLGVPRQEFWIAANRHLCPQAIWIGVGGSFDIWAGTKARAPEWFRKHHLEWLYRLYQEPWRWKRMLALPKFVWRVLTDRVLGS